VGVSEKRWRRVKTDYSDDDDVYSSKAGVYRAMCREGLIE